MTSKIIFLKFLLFCVLVLNMNEHGLAQHHEIGFGMGALNYAGDLSRGYNAGNVRPGGELYYRYNFNPITSFRAFTRFGGLSGADDKPIDAAAAIRNTSFELFLTELGVDFEYNFLDIKSAKSLNNWTPFLFFGAGIFQVIGDDPLNEGGNFSTLHFMVPFGTGIKAELSPTVNFELQIGARKLFTDWLDGVSDKEGLIKNYQYGNKHDKDWYNYIGISISYTIYTVNCPYDFKNSRSGK